MEESKLLIAIERKQLEHIFHGTTRILLGNPVTLKLIDNQESAYDSWKKAILLQAVFDSIDTEFFTHGEDSGSLKSVDQSPIYPGKDDVIWLNKVLNKNPVFPLKFNITQKGNTLYFKSNYTFTD